MIYAESFGIITDWLLAILSAGLLAMGASHIHQMIKMAVVINTVDKHDQLINDINIDIKDIKKLLVDLDKKIK